MGKNGLLGLFVKASTCHLEFEKRELFSVDTSGQDGSNNTLVTHFSPNTNVARHHRSFHTVTTCARVIAPRPHNCNRRYYTYRWTCLCKSILRLSGTYRPVGLSKGII